MFKGLQGLQDSDDYIQKVKDARQEEMKVLAEEGEKTKHAIFMNLIQNSNHNRKEIKDALGYCETPIEKAFVMSFGVKSRARNLTEAFEWVEELIDEANIKFSDQDRQVVFPFVGALVGEQNDKNFSNVGKFINKQTVAMLAVICLFFYWFKFWPFKA